jgi:hypothetical protein
LWRSLTMCVKIHFLFFASIPTFNVFRARQRKRQMCSGLLISPHLSAFKMQVALHESGCRSKLKDECMWVFYRNCWDVNVYLLTPWGRVLLEKLTVSFAASQEFPRIYGTRKFLTVPTRARHLSLSWANTIQSPRPPPTSWRSILILSSHLRLGLPNGLFPSGFPTNRCQCI